MSQQEVVAKNTHLKNQLTNPKIFNLSIQNAREVRRFFNRKLEKQQEAFEASVFNDPIAMSA